MGSGSLFRALQRTNFGKDMGGLVKEYITNKRRNEELVSLAGMMETARDRMAATNMPMQGRTGQVKPAPVVDTVTPSVDATTPVINRKMRDINDDPMSIVTNKSQETPQINASPITPPQPMNYREAQDEKTQALIDAYIGISGLQNVPAEQRQANLQALQLQSQLGTPAKQEWEKVNDWLIPKDQYGNLDYSSAKNFGSQVPDVEGNIKNSQTKTYWTYNKTGPNAGKYVDTGIAYDPNEGKSNVTVQAPKSDKWGTVAAAIADAETTKVWDSVIGKLDSLTSEEQAQRWNKAKRLAYGSISGKAKGWLNDKDATDWKGKTNHEQMSSQEFLQAIRDDVAKGVLDPEAATDLMDFDAYRKDLWKINPNPGNKKK